MEMADSTPGPLFGNDEFIWVFPKNSGTPKSSILIRFSIIFTIHFGVPLFLETPSWRFLRSQWPLIPGLHTVVMYRSLRLGTRCVFAAPRGFPWVWGRREFPRYKCLEPLRFWKYIPFGKLTWQWKIRKMDLLKMYSLFKMGIFYCHC